MIPLVNLVAQYARYKDEIDLAMRRVVEEQQFIGGEEVRKFEYEWGAYCGVDYAIGASSGTDALILALEAVGVQPGDRVITTPFTFIATAEAISRLGAEPLFVDVDRQTLNLDPKQTRTALDRVSGEAAAIVPVHIYGRTADMSAFQDISWDYGIPVVEDACQAHGATDKGGRKAGGLGHIAAFSHYPGKNLGAYGDAGSITTNNPTLARAVRSLRDHGRAEKHIHTTIGHNARLDAIQAAVLRVKLKRLDLWNLRRRAIAGEYAQRLRAVDVTLPHMPAGTQKHACHCYTIRTEKRDALAKHLQQHGISTGVHYPIPVHRQPPYAGCNPEGSCPEAELAARDVLSLPICPELTNNQVTYICDQIVDFFQRG